MTGQPTQYTIDAVRRMNAAEIDRALRDGSLDDLLSGRQPRAPDPRADARRALRARLATMSDDQIVEATRRGEFDAFFLAGSDAAA